MSFLFLIFFSFDICSFPGKAVGVSIASQSAPADTTPAKEAAKVCTFTFMSVHNVVV